MDYIEALRRRITLSEMSEVCSKLGIIRQRSWVDLRTAISQEMSVSLVRESEIITGLEAAFRKTITCGDRAVLLFKPDSKQFLKIAAGLAALAPQSSSFFSSYPLPLDEAELAKQDDSLFLCEVTQSGKQLTLVFCGKRLIEEKVEKSASSVNPLALKSIGWSGYDEFVLVKRRFVQTYEVVLVDYATGLIELRVEDHQGVKAGESIQQLQNSVNLLLFGNAPSLAGAVNLFPAIRALYDAVKEGIVVELGFTTATGSAKNEKMRAHRKDLRLEAFHVGGKAAIKGLLTPFRVAVRWQDDGAPSVELLLPGSMRQLSKTSPVLEYCVITGAISERVLRDCIARLVKYLP